MSATATHAFALSQALVALLSGCCSGGGSAHDYYFGAYTVDGYGTYDLNWGRETNVVGGLLPSDTDVGSVEALITGPEPPDYRRFFEVFEVPVVGEEGDARPVDVEVSYGVKDNSCAPTITVAMTGLPHGVYMVVHRRSSGAPGAGDGFPWQAYEGEDALVTWFVIDGDRSDGRAGPRPRLCIVGAMTLAPGRTFRGLTVHGELARGGMGTAYLASHAVLKTPLVLKTFAPREDDLFREAHLAARVSSPHVVGVLDAGVEDGVPFVVQRYVDGLDLAELIGRAAREDRLLPTAAVVRLVRDVARGLGAIHRAGVIHRDIKPANLFLSGGGEALVGDFGIALDPYAELDAEAAGTPAFVAPEVWRGEPPRPASDLYALGATAHLAATGQPPFLGTDPGTLRVAHTSQPYVAPPTRDPARAYLFTAIAALLDKDPIERPESAEELARTLARIEDPRAALVPTSPVSAELAGLAIELSVGDLATVSADVIVNAAYGAMTMDVGVAASLRLAGGAEIETEALAHAPLGMGEVAWTGAGGLAASHVAHAVAAMSGAVCVQRATLRTLLGARARGARSIAFPALGTGVGQVPHALAAKLMFEATRTFADLDPWPVEHVRFVLYDEAARDAWSSVLTGM